MESFFTPFVLQIIEYNVKRFYTNNIFIVKNYCTTTNLNIKFRRPLRALVYAIVNIYLYFIKNIIQNIFI